MIVFFSLSGKNFWRPPAKVSSSPSSIPGGSLENVTGNIVRIEEGSLFITVQEGGEEVKLRIDEKTRFSKLTLPFDAENPPEEAVFSPALKEIPLSGLRAGQRIFAEGERDAAGLLKAQELQVLP